MQLYVVIFVNVCRNFSFRFGLTLFSSININNYLYFVSNSCCIGQSELSIVCPNLEIAGVFFQLALKV